MNGWTQQRRERQSKLIQQWQPWKQSTGPKTPEGKAGSSQNAYKGGTRQLLRRLSQLMREQRDQVEMIE